MKVTNAYKTLTVESEITTKDISIIKSEGLYDALNLIEDDRTVFSVGIGSTGGITPTEIVFDSNTKEGNLYVTIFDKKIPDGDAEKKKEFLENYNRIFVKLQRVEAQVKEALAMPSIIGEIDINIV